MHGIVVKDRNIITHNRREYKRHEINRNFFVVSMALLAEELLLMIEINETLVLQNAGPRIDLFYLFLNIKL